MSRKRELMSSEGATGPRRPQSEGKLKSPRRTTMLDEQREVKQAFI